MTININILVENVNQLKESVKKWDMSEDEFIVYTGSTALTLYGIMVENFIPPLTIVNLIGLLDEDLNSDSYQMFYAYQKLSQNEYIICNGIKITTPRRAIKDLVMINNVNDVYELEDCIEGTAWEEVYKEVKKELGVLNE